MTFKSSRRLSTVIQSPSSNGPEEMSYSSNDKFSLRGLPYFFLFLAVVWYTAKRDRDRFYNLSEEAQEAELMSTSLPIIFTALILVAALVPIFLYQFITSSHLYYYWTTVNRSSGMALRLFGLRSDLLQVSSRLRAIAGTSRDDGAELQVWTSGASLAQLHDLTKTSDLSQLGKYFGRLRDAAKRLNHVTGQLDQSLERRVFDTLQSCITRLKAFRFPWQNVRHCMSSTYSSWLTYGFQIYPKEGGAKPPSTGSVEEIMRDLHEAAKRVVVCPLPFVSRMCDWENSYEAQDLVEKAEIAMESIQESTQTLLDNLPQLKISGLDFDKFAVVACWEFPVPNLQKASTAKTPELFSDDPTYDLNTLLSHFDESLLGVYTRTMVRKNDVTPRGRFRGKLICR